MMNNILQGYWHKMQVLFSKDNKERIIIFDGVCIFCNKALDILIKLDRDKVFKYTSLQGEYVKGLGIDEGIDSIILYEENTLYYKSTAILKILRNLGKGWIIINIFYVIPQGLRDRMYDFIARYRYRIFGKMRVCRTPKKMEEALFID